MGSAGRGLRSWWSRVSGPFTPSHPGAGFRRGRPQGPPRWKLGGVGPAREPWAGTGWGRGGREGEAQLGGGGLSTQRADFE